MTQAWPRWNGWGQVLGFVAFSLVLSLLAGCDATPLSNSNTAGAAGISGSSGGSGVTASSGAGGASGSSHGARVSIPTTTSIVVHVPSGGSGGTTGTAGSAGSDGSPVSQCVPAQPGGSPPSTAVCGDGFRAATEACDDGNTLPGDGCSPACQITPQLVSQRVQPPGEITRINAGSGSEVGLFSADRFYTDGGFYIGGNEVSTSGVENAAPPEVYQSERVGDFAYTLSGLSPRLTYRLRLHFAEIWFEDDDVGTRVFNVEINGQRVLENFDIVAVAGGANKAVVREFSAAANSDGQVIVNFVTVANNAKVSALELIPPTDPPPVTTEPIARINGGGEAEGPFLRDQSVDGGGTYATDTPIDTTGVAYAAPEAVYRSERWGNFTYLFGGLKPGAQYVVRLHFAEIYFSTPGSRAFNVSINGGFVLEYFDIVKEAGGPNIAIVREFSAVANSDGQVFVNFEGRIDNAKISGLELLRPVASRSIGASRHPLAAGCNAIASTFSDHSDDSAAVYLSTFESAGHPLTSVRVTQTHVSTPNPGVAALPGDDFVVAWTDFDDDELGISLSKVVAGVSLGKPVIANEDPAFSQSESDIVFDGTELVVAWLDSHDAAKGPDLHYRLFTPDLEPLSGDQVLAATDAVEDNVVLAGRNGHWAAAWRAGSLGQETIEVQSGASHWTVGPFLPGATADRPDLIFLDDTHLAVAFTMGTDPDNTGEADVARLHAAVLDPRMPGVAESFMIAPAQMPYATDGTISQTDPSLILVSDHLLVAWRSEARPGEHLGSELWSRRIPFTVSGDSVTLDPSHLEMPVIQAEAQREGDQGAFRMVSTSLWPSGGIATVWDDSGRSYGSKSAAPEVVLQVGPEFKEAAPPPLTSYAVSDDGLYYKVNLLRRNYPGPTINRSYQGDATYFIPQMTPEAAFDGDDNWWAYSSASGTDSNAGATLTIDMGQYFSVGAVRLLYYYTGNAPPTQSLRLSTNPADSGNWQTILNNTPGFDDHTYSFSAITARYLELKMKGAPRGGIMEVEVFPSTQTGPAPSPLDGYDLSYFATATANSNCRQPQPWLFASAATIANVVSQGIPPYATGDCVETYDLGAQYPVSRVYTNFYAGSNWWTGGRIDVAAVPGVYSNVYDSGVGNQFAFTDAVGFTAPSQPVRYIALTDYAVPGVGPGNGILESIQAFVTPAPRTAYYPLSDDRKYFFVNIARRPTGDIQPTATIAYSNGAGVFTWNTVQQNPANALDGDDLSLNWMAASGSLTTATATITVDLGQVQSIGAVRQLYGNYGPLSYSARAAQSLSGPWTQLANDAAFTTNPATTSFDALSARYVEFTIKGTTSVAFVNLLELMVYPSSTLDPAPNSGSHLDLTYLPGMSATWNANVGVNGEPRTHYIPGAAGYYVKTAAQGGTGDGTVTIDLGQQYSISETRLVFFGNQTWPGGGRIDLDDGTGNWVNVFDTGRGTMLGPTPDGTQTITFAPHLARRLRLTGYFDPALGQGLLENIEVY